ncbi:MAG: hypothetical protein KGY39_08040 [Anaerolineales bacterium]|nr:hypothetical protein [Anaerolineales bacterium]MBS3753822.1 hypothetical protein [Anaerolineales bacterium]
MTKNKREPASFRDPSGYIFWKDNQLYRQINLRYQSEYDLLMGSGLYQRLVDAGLLIPHRKVRVEPFDADHAYLVIHPEQIPFISYPYEWSFSQLQDAALATLRIQKHALDYGMSLKDSSGYNIQFWKGQPVLIDTLSFEILEEGKPWMGYRQFCQHFLAPLSLMSYKDVRLSQLLRIYLDGIPLDMASKLLPFRTRLNFSLLTHIHLHAAAQNRYAGREVDLSSPKGQIQERGLEEGIISSLESSVRKLEWHPEHTAWADYAATHSYSDTAFNRKKEIISQYLDRLEPDSVWDLGANVGEFSRLASQRGIRTVAFDFDPGAVELNYRQCVEEGDEKLLPLLIDLTNPSPDIGWHNQERHSVYERGGAELIFALALIHHLAITNNTPLEKIASFLSELGDWLVIEFIPKDDPQTQQLLASREDIFSEYSQPDFERMFQRYFHIEDVEEITGSERLLYLMKKK